MAKQKLTSWYPGFLKPERVGFYQCREGLQRLWYWDGTYWMSPARTFKCSFQDRQWRGLASDPAVKK